MKHTLLNGRVIEISDSALRNLMDACGCTITDAVDIWLTDHDFIVNEEQENLDKTAKKVHISRDIDVKKSKKERKKPEKKVSDEKKELFSEILSDLEDVYRNNVKVLNENKLIEVKIGKKTFKINITENRKAT